MKCPKKRIALYASDYLLSHTHTQIIIRVKNARSQRIILDLIREIIVASAGTDRDIIKFNQETIEVGSAGQTSSVLCLLEHSVSKLFSCVRI